LINAINFENLVAEGKQLELFAKNAHPFIIKTQFYRWNMIGIEILL